MLNNILEGIFPLIKMYSVRDVEESLKHIDRYLRTGKGDPYKLCDASLLCSDVTELSIEGVSCDSGPHIVNTTRLKRLYNECTDLFGEWKSEHPEADDESTVFYRNRLTENWLRRISNQDSE